MNRLPLVSFLALAALVPVRSAQITKLNAPLAFAQRAGRVSEALLTSDGVRVVYRADLTEGQWEVFSRPLDGSTPSVKLNSPLHAQGDVGVNGTVQGSIALAAGDRVVYVADAFVENQYQIFSAPADGGALAVLLSPPGTPVVYEYFTTGYSFSLSPDGTRVLFRTGNSFLGTGALHIVPADGSAPFLTLIQGSTVAGSWVSPDGSLVAYSVWVSGNEQQDLYVIPADGSQPPLFLARTHAPSLIGQVSVSELVFSPDGTRVVFTELDDLDGDFTYDLSSVPVDASQPKVGLNPGSFGGDFELVTVGGTARVFLGTGSGYATVNLDGTGFTVLSPPGTSRRGNPVIDGAEAFFGGFSSGATSIYRAPLDGSQSASLVCVVNGALGEIVVASPTQLAFLARNASSQGLAYAVPRNGGTPLPLHPAPPAGQGPSHLIPHPDGVRLLMQGSLVQNEPYSLYALLLDASQPPLRLLTPADGLFVSETTLTPDGVDAIVFAREPAGLDGDLYLLPVDGSAAPVQLNEAVAGDTAGDVTGFELSPDGAWLVYRADLDADEDFDLVALDANHVQRRLGDGVGSAFPQFAFTPDSTRVVYQTLESFTSVLRVTELASGTTLVLDQGPETLVGPYAFDAAGARVVYRRQTILGQIELRAVALDGLSVPVELHGALPAGRSVGEFRVAADSVVFVADLDQDNVQELWASPLAGGIAPVRLNPALVAGGDVTDLALDPTGTVAVFLADAQVDERFELYRAPLDGSAPAVRLSGPMPPLGDVMEFALTPDGTRAVYRADVLSDGRFDLFSVPLALFPPHATPGGERRTRVTRLSRLQANRNVRPDWRLSPDGSQVVYRADPTLVGVLELLRVPVDGSTLPVALSGVLGSASDVATFVIAPDQSRIAFLADLRANEVVEPYSVPFAGGTVVPLDVLPNFGDVSAARIDPSSHDLVFSADRQQDGVVELFRVPLDGSLPARLLNVPLAPNRDVQVDFIPLPVGTLYRADQQQDEVLELYLAF